MKKLQFYIQAVDNQTPFAWPEIDKVQSFCEAGGDGCYEITIKKAIKPKSQQQLGAIFGMLIKDAIAQANDIGLDTSSFLKEMVREDLPSGIGLTTDFLKEILYCLCPIMRDGKRITLSKASTVEAAKFFDDARNLLAAHGIFIQEPNPHYKEKRLDNDNE